MERTGADICSWGAKDRHLLGVPFPRGLWDRTGVETGPCKSPGKGIRLTEVVTTNKVLGTDYRYTEHRICSATQQETHWPFTEEIKRFLQKVGATTHQYWWNFLKTNKKAVSLRLIHAERNEGLTETFMSWAKGGAYCLTRDLCLFFFFLGAWNNMEDGIYVPKYWDFQYSLFVKTKRHNI